MVYNIIRFAVAIGILGYLAHRVGFVSALEHARDGDKTILGFGTLVLAFQPIIASLRWYSVLRSNKVKASLFDVTRWYYISVFWGQVLPATVGSDAMRVLYATRQSVSLKDAVTSVTIDRIGMLLVLIFLLCFSIPFLRNYIDGLTLSLALLVIGGGSIAVLAVLAFGDKLPPRAYEVRLVRAVGHLARDAKRLLAAPSKAFSVLGLCLASYATLMASIYLFAVGFGADASLSDILVLTPPVLAAGMAPISLGGWGTRELAMVAALGTAGIPAEPALLASLWLGVASVLISGPGFVFFVMDRKKSSADAAAIKAEGLPGQP